MDLDTIAVLMPGDMGHAVGKVLGDHGHRVITNLTGRGNHSRNLAQAGNLEDVGSLDEIVTQADLILSILPPAAALALASEVASQMSALNRYPVYVDCNAVSPQTAQQAAKTITDCGAPFIDAGIIGAAPGRGAAPRRRTWVLWSGASPGGPYRRPSDPR